MGHLASKSRKLVKPPGERYAKNAGFTLVEIMVIIVIIGIVAALAVPNYRRLNDNMKFEDAYGSTKAAFNKCRGQAVSMESAKDMSSPATMPVSIVLFTNGYACIVWYDKSPANNVLGSGSAITPSDDGELDEGDANGEVQRVLFQDRYDTTLAINAVTTGPRIATTHAQSVLKPSGSAQNDGTGYIFRILPGGYFLSANGGMMTASVVMLPKEGPQTVMTLYPSGQVVGQ